MKCPKCLFEQPKDQFCAKCGVNVETYKSPASLFSGIGSLGKGILFFALILVAIIFVLKNIEKNITSPLEVDIGETSQFGSGASSLKVERADFQELKPKSINIQPMSASSRSAPPPTATKPDATPSVKFNQINVSVTVAEHGGLDLFENTEAKADKTWHLVSQASPIYTAITEEVVLKNGNNTFEFDDALISYDISFFMEEITDKDVKIRLNMRRGLRAQTAGSQSATISINERIPLDKTLIIVDRLPRRASVDRPDSFLSTLYKSESFLSGASELVQIIKFENPSNSPQE